MSNEVFNAVDALPLAGKFTVRLAMQSAIRAPKEHASARFIGAGAVLGLFVAVHGSQTYFGYDAFSEHIGNASESGASPAEALWAGVDAAYLSINAAVTVRQTALLGKLPGIGRRRQAREERLDVPNQTLSARPKKLPEGTWKKVGTALAVTLAGQLLFLASYYDAMNDRHIDTCHEASGQYYDQVSIESGGNMAETRDEYLGRACI